MPRIGSLLALLAGCAESLLSPSPSLSGLEPGLVCVEQLDTEVVVTGDGLTPLPSDLIEQPAALILPELSLTLVAQIDGADGAGSPVALDVTWSDAQTMGFRVTPSLSLAPGVYDLTANNAGGGSASLPASLAGVPAPTAATLTPDRMCLAQGDRPIAIEGTGFLDVGGALPVLTVGSLSLPADSLDGCTPLAGPVTGSRCDGLTATLPQDALPQGEHGVLVTNPETAACSTEADLSIAVFDAPVLTSIESPLVCSDAANTLVLTGTGFLVVDGVNPTITIGDTLTRPADRAVACGPEERGVATCTALEIEVTAGELPLGLLPVVVSNPDPVGCSSEEAVALEVVGPPVIATLTPPSSCTFAADVALVIDGSGFLEVGGVLPTVTLDGTAYSPTIALCTPLVGSLAGSVCDQLTILVPGGTYPNPDVLDLVVTNPPPADCGSATTPWEVALPPTITDVEPDASCDDGETITVYGSNFSAGSQVLVGGLDTTETFVSDTELQATLPYGIGAGVYDVTVTTGSGCDATLPGGLTLVGVPYVFFVDPSVVYNAVPIRATVYASGINGDVADAWLEEASTGLLVPLPFEYNPLDPGVVLVDIPEGLPEGSYHLHLTDGYGCDPFLLDALFVEADLTLAIDAIEPTFGWTLDTTSTRITAAAGGLLDIPRVYLSPVSQGPGAFASELRGVSLADPTAIDAVVPSGLPLGFYDVLVINPDGQIGALLAGFEVVANQPPLVDAISPGSLPNDGVYPIFIQGEGFLGSGVGPPTVVADCVDPSNGNSEQVVAVVRSWTATSIDADFDANLGIGNGICVFTVTNDDGTFGTYSA